MTCRHGYIGACPQGCDIPDDEEDCDVMECEECAVALEQDELQIGEGTGRWLCPVCAGKEAG